MTAEQMHELGRYKRLLLDLLNAIREDSADHVLDRVRNGAALEEIEALLLQNPEALIAVSRDPHESLGELKTITMECLRVDKKVKSTVAKVRILQTRFPPMRKRQQTG